MKTAFMIFGIEVGVVAGPGILAQLLGRKYITAARGQEQGNMVGNYAGLHRCRSITLQESRDIGQQNPCPFWVIPPVTHASVAHLLSYISLSENLSRNMYSHSKQMDPFKVPLVNHSQIWAIVAYSSCHV